MLSSLAINKQKHVKISNQINKMNNNNLKAKKT